MLQISVVLIFVFIALGSASTQNTSSGSSGYTPAPLQHTPFPEVGCDGCSGKGYYMLFGEKYTCSICNGTGKKPK